MANTKVTGDLIASSTIATGNIADNAVTSDKISGITTAHITEGTNLYYTDARADARAALLVDSAPSTLNTLNELAAALGDDPNYAATTATTIGLKAPIASPSFTGNSTFAGNVLIDGVSNYTGLVVKGSGASRPAITWSNVNQGDLGIIYGTESNALVIATGASGLAALTLDSSQNATFAAELSIASFIRHTGDTNTYIGFPSDDTIKLVTASNEIIRIDSSGNINVGEGTNPKGNILMGNTVVNPASGFADQTGIGLKNSSTVPELQVSSDSTAMQLGRTTTGGDGQILALRKAGTIIHNFDTNNVSIGTNATFAGNVTISQPTNGSDAILNLTSKSSAGNSRTSSIEYDADNEYMYFKNAGTTVATMTSGGNVGIGVTSPDAQLDIHSSGSWGQYGRGSGGEINVENTNTSVNEGGWIGIAGYTGNTANNGFYPMAGITAKKSTASGDGNYGGDLSFWTTAGTGQSPEANSGMYQRMTINRFGKVGIGTDSPGAKLDIATTGSVAKPPSLRISNAAAAGYLWDIWRDNTTGYLNIGSTTNGTDAGAHVTIKDVNGNVGIGTVSPNYQLEVRTTTNNRAIQAVNSTTSGTNWGFQGGAYGVGASKNIGLQITAEGASTNYAALFTGGNVGIGTTSPQSKLDLLQPDSSANTLGQSVTAALGIRIANAVGQVGQIVFNNDAAPSYGYGSIGMIMTSGTGVGLGDMIFSTKSTGSDSASTERMRINSSGNVTKPTSCAFSASTTTPGFSVGTTEVKIAYSSQQVDANSNYDTTNYRFTAPVAGNYLIGTTNTCYISTGVTVYMAIYIRKNGVGTAYRFRGGGVDLDVNDWFGITGSVVIPLAAGDYIELWGYANAGSFQIVNTEGHFYGYLIG